MTDNLDLIVKAIQDRMEEFKNDPVISQHSCFSHLTVITTLAG